MRPHTAPWSFWPLRALLKGDGGTNSLTQLHPEADVLDVMRRNRVSLLFVLTLSSAAASLAVASAGTFSQAVRLGGPTTGLVWNFAVNNRGQAVAVEGSEHGVSVFPIGSAGHLGKPWQVKLPGGFPGGETSVTLDSRGRIAVGILYFDNTREPGHEEHGGPGCCLRVAIASWQLGAKPPLAQSLSPPQSAKTGFGHHALQAPFLVIGRSAITALWTVGSESERERKSGPGEVQVEQAFGRFGWPLRTAMLFAAPDGVSVPSLSLEPSGVPVASWLDGREEIRTVTGARSGALPRPTRVQRAPHLSEPVGFTSDYEGDTVFAYWSPIPRGMSELRYMRSKDGGPFTPPRAIGATGPGLPEGTVVAGGHHTLLALWCLELTSCSTYRGRRVQMTGGTSSSFRIDGKPEGFLDSHGRAQVIYTAGAAGLFERAAQLGQPLGQSRRIAVPLREFSLGAEHDEEPPLPTSPNGHAILYFTNDDNHQYLVRYTP